jgi:signal transduction histidine kinase
MREKRPLLLWQAGAWRALVETFLVGSILMTGLMPVADYVPPNVIGQGFLFLSPACALLCALRLRPSDQGQAWRRLFREGIVAVMLSLLMSAGLLAIMSALGWQGTLASTTFGRGGISLLLAAAGPAFLVFRGGMWLWRAWDRLRRRQLLWALTHAHLTVVVVMALLFAVLLTVQVLVAEYSDRFEPEGGGLAALLAVRIVLTILPAIGAFSAFTVILLTIALPPSAIFSTIVARRTTRRLDALVAATKALRTGDYAARVDIVGEDEVTQLQAGFNAMAADLERAMGELAAERDKVASLLQARRELVASVSHELRTPVATLRGYLESALKNWDHTPPPTLRYDLEVMDGEAARLQKLLDDLFTLSQAEVSGLMVDLQPTDVDAIVQRRVRAAAPPAWESGRVEIVAEVPPDLPPALADEGRLDQVLVNLLRNSVRHTPPGGIVAVMVAPEQDTVRIEVRDTGEGIPPEELPHIWERFYRGRSSRAEDSRGAGLGLALVKELTEAMGGTVAVESAVGQGSCFTVWLPKA